MVREYLEQDVYEVLQDRLRLIFEEFENIYVSFSGGEGQRSVAESGVGF